MFHIQSTHDHWKTTANYFFTAGIFIIKNTDTSRVGFGLLVFFSGFRCITFFNVVFTNKTITYNKLML